MVLKLYNSLGRRLEAFAPIDEGEVRMYTCGPTVWNYAHIGNLRTFVFEDVLRRYLKFKGLKVTQVMNVTDVEDKIIKGMKLFHKSREELTRFYEGAFMNDLSTLRVERAERYPRASEHIPEMVALIHRLLDEGYAYRSEDGSIYFAISKFERYGELSGIKPSQLRAGARVKQDNYEKEEAIDFALWKAWDSEDGDVFWETDLGKGRPGWHIECSAMSMKYLGESFDIHTGGLDNKFPHHENEIAQSEAATKKRFVRYWLHSNFLNVEGEEMHKSVGNVVYLSDLTKEGWNPLTIRLFLVSARYRDPMNLTESLLAQAEAQRGRLQELVRRLQNTKKPGAVVGSALADELQKKFTEAMDDDLGTPGALAAVFETSRKANTLMDEDRLTKDEASRLLAVLRKIDQVLGVLDFEEETLAPELVELLEKRDRARRAKDFEEADRIRDLLRQKGIEVQDGTEGSTWKRASSG